MLSSSTARLETRTTARKVLVNSTIGPSTSSRVWLSTRVQTGAANASSSMIGHAADTNGAWSDLVPSVSATWGSTWDMSSSLEAWEAVDEVKRTWPESSV